MTVDKPTLNKTENTVVFTITVSNGGPDNATGVKVKDLLPAGLTYSSHSPGETYNSGTGIWDVGTLTSGGVGSTDSLTITATVTASFLPITNKAEVSSWDAGQTDPNSTPGNNSTTEDDDASTIITTQNANLSLTKTVNTTTPIVGSNVVFTVNVQNTGPFQATNVTVTDLLPGSLTYISHTGAGTYVPGTGLWTLPTPLGVGAGASLQITASVDVPGPITNTATISNSDQYDNNPANDQASITLNPDTSDLSLSIAVNNTTPDKNDNVVFTVTLNNAGPTTATNVVVTDVFPSGLSNIIDDDGGVGAPYPYNSNTWTIPSLPSGASAVLNITANVITQGAKIYSAQVWSSDQLDPNSTPGNNSTTEDDDASISLIPEVSDLSLIKTVDNPIPNNGDTVVFTITVNNNGPDIATNVLVADVLPVPFTYISDDDGGGAFPYNAGVWSIPSLANGASAILHITALTGPGTLNTNYAEIMTSDQIDPDSTPGNGLIAEDDQDGSPSADLSLSMTVSNPSPPLGSDITFVLTVNNIGVGTANNVFVKDILPAGLEWQSDNGAGAYNSGTGLWNVGSLTPSGVGSTATISIVAKVMSTGVKTNFAEIVTSSLLDPDSTVSNGSVTEDDDANAVVTPAAGMLVIISEVAWAGTVAEGDDEWIELYNPGTSDININGWKLKDNSSIISLTGSIPAGGYYLIEDTSVAVSDVTHDLIFNMSLSNSGESLELYDGSNILIDTANKDGGSWPAGDVDTKGTMERIVSKTDSDDAWVTNTGFIKNGKDRNGGDIWGTPKNPAPVSTPTPTPSGGMSIVISEVAWAGTAANSSDEWVELYNPGASQIDITGWKLIDGGGTEIILNGKIDPGSFFLLEDNENTVSDIIASQLDGNLALTNEGETLQLLDGSNTIIDSANNDGGGWPAGSNSTYGTMERIVSSPDGNNAWYTNAGIVKNGKDANGGDIWGTPKQGNSPIPTATATATPITQTPTRTLTPTKTVTPTRTVTRTPTAEPVGRPVINEFLARPGYDWNRDGFVDVYDEFIEIKNIGIVEINLKGWKLDDEADSGSTPFTFPDLLLLPGDRVVFYGNETRILLSDGGDTVRLLNASNKVYDAYTYPLAKFKDKSVCRMPDGNGSWYEDCIPTPNLTNSRQGSVPSMPGGSNAESELCDFPDTMPEDFIYAECRGFGGNIWDTFFWDQFGWLGRMIFQPASSKWEIIVE
ncbi:MAG TPA: lamin tail domain-containing protein [Anaerolineales bacterium]|nr:lamin tail domain-containing protein [Anaerolineales bacterium]